MGTLFSTCTASFHTADRPLCAITTYAEEPTSIASYALIVPAKAYCVILHRRIVVNERTCTRARPADTADEKMCPCTNFTKHECRAAMHETMLCALFCIHRTFVDCDAPAQLDMLERTWLDCSDDRSRWGGHCYCVDYHYDDHHQHHHGRDFTL